jgi:GTP cyclohydrolase I
MNKIISGQSFQGKEDKQKRLPAVEAALGQFLTALGYDWANDPNMRETPHRVAKMYLNEVTTGTYDAPPRITDFENTSKFKGMVVQKRIEVKSLCSHHLQPFIGKAFVAYIPGDSVVGLSKLNRVVEYFARRPQLQEQLTQQVHDFINEALPGNKGVAVYISCQHLCCKIRGVNDDSEMDTPVLSGAFDDESSARAEFYSIINSSRP